MMVKLKISIVILIFKDISAFMSSSNTYIFVIPFSQSRQECFLGYEEPSSQKHYNFGVGKQLCFCLQQGQSESAFQHVCIFYSYQYI